MQLIQDLFSIDPQRLRIFKAIGTVAQLIFHNSKTQIRPNNLAVVLPVEDECMLSSLPTAAEAKIMMEDHMMRSNKWNAVFGLILANSDLFFFHSPYDSLKTTPSSE